MVKIISASLSETNVEWLEAQLKIKPLSRSKLLDEIIEKERKNSQNQEKYLSKNDCRIIRMIAARGGRLPGWAIAQSLGIPTYLLRNVQSPLVASVATSVWTESLKKLLEINLLKFEDGYYQLTDDWY